MHVYVPTWQRLYDLTRMFSGFRSACTRPRECRKAREVSTCEGRGGEATVS